MRISHAEYCRVLSCMPLLCVDGVILNSAGRVLLVKRNNAPLKNRWWVPGGRVLKGETVERAFRRKMREELGVKVAAIRCVGYFEAANLRHSGLNGHGGRAHSLSIVFETRLNTKTVVLDSQSSDWGFFEKLPALFKIQPLE